MAVKERHPEMCPNNNKQSVSFINVLWFVCSPSGGLSDSSSCVFREMTIHNSKQIIHLSERWESKRSAVDYIFKLERLSCEWASGEENLCDPSESLSVKPTGFSGL